MDFARRVIEEEAGYPLELPSEQTAAATPDNGSNGERKLVARDSKKTPLLSEFEWNGGAVERLFRVPAGYMRDKAQERTEKLARERGLAAIEVALLEEGIEVGRLLMEELLDTNDSSPAAATAPAPDSATAQKEEGRCPFAGMAAGSRSKTDGSNGKEGHDLRLYLNEVGFMSAMAAKQKRE